MTSERLPCEACPWRGLPPVAAYGDMAVRCDNKDCPCRPQVSRISGEPFIETMRRWNRRAPIETNDGLAALADELEWQERKSR